MLENEIKTNLKQQTISGIGWTMVAQVGREVFRFIISIILARLLTPRDYGLVGMVVVFTGFAHLFGDAGFSGALIQRETVEERLLSDEAHLLVVRAFGKLPEREQSVLAWRLALGGKPSLTLRQIAARMRISCERVRQIQNDALRRLLRLVTASYAVNVKAAVVSVPPAGPRSTPPLPL